MTNRMNSALVSTILVSFMLAACGGGGGTSSVPNAVSSYGISGTVTGLASGQKVVLLNNSADA